MNTQPKGAKHKLGSPIYHAPAPCDSCSNLSFCRDNQTACLDFYRFVVDGELRHTRSRENPSKQMYENAMKG